MQIIKLALGLAGSLGIKEGFKLLLPQDIPALYNFFRYFVTALAATAGVPALFRLLRLYGNFGKPMKEKSGGAAEETTDNMGNENKAD